jgi:hypothetical protein
MKLKIYHIPLCGIFTYGLTALFINLNPKLPSVTKVPNTLGKSTSLVSADEIKSLQADANIMFEACAKRGVQLDKIKDYSTGVTHVTLPKGSYIVTKDANNNNTHYEIQMTNFGDRLVLKRDQKVTSCGKFNFGLLKRHSVRFGQLDPKVYSFEITTSEGQPTTTFLKVKGASETRVYVAFIEGQAPDVVKVFGRQSSIQNYGDINNVRIGSFDMSE